MVLKQDNLIATVTDNKLAPLGQEVMANWLADVFGIDQRALTPTGWRD